MRKLDGLEVAVHGLAGVDVDQRAKRLLQRAHVAEHAAVRLAVDDGRCRAGEARPLPI